MMRGGVTRAEPIHQCRINASDARELHDTAAIVAIFALHVPQSARAVPFVSRSCENANSADAAPSQEIEGPQQAVQGTLLDRQTPFAAGGEGKTSRRTIGRLACRSGLFAAVADLLRKCQRLAGLHLHIGHDTILPVIVIRHLQVIATGIETVERVGLAVIE